MTGDIELRAARPEAGDLAAYCRLLPLTHHGARSAPRRGLDLLFYDPHSLHSCGCTHFAGSEAEVLGFVTCFPGSEYRSRAEAAAGGTGARVLRRLRGSRLGPLDDQAFHLQAIAVDPRAQHRGIGTRLFRHAVRLGVLAGSRRLTIDTDVRNTAGLAFFQDLGCTHVCTRGRLAKLQLDIRS